MIRNLLAQKMHQFVVFHLIEELLQIRFNDPRVAQVQILLRFNDGLMSIAIRTEAVAVIEKITLILYPKPLGNALLDNTVDDRGDTQHTLAATGFGNLYFPNCLWAVSARENIRSQGLPVRVKVVTKIIDLHTINSANTSIRDDTINCVFDISDV